MALSSPVCFYVFRSVKLALKAYVKTHCTLPTSKPFCWPGTTKEESATPTKRNGSLETSFQALNLIY